MFPAVRAVIALRAIERTTAGPVEYVEISPSEAKRVLGAEVADSLTLGGPVVVVRGRLPSAEFEADDRKYQYHDGMLGTVEISVREERIVFALVPGLRKL